MLPAVSVAARGEVGEGERVRRWVRRVVWGVREVSIICMEAEEDGGVSEGVLVREN